MIGYKEKQYKLEKLIEDYDMYHSYYLDDDKVRLGNKDKKKCRFCGKEDGEVTFSMVAHAVPELMGNTSLISYYECDECNKHFAKTCEQNLGNYLTVYRALLGSKGKKGIIKYRKHDKMIFTDKEEDARVIICRQGSENMEIDEENNRVYFSNESEPYIPSEVYKCFIKIFLSLVNEEDISQLEWYIKYISRLDSNNITLHSGAIIFDAFVPNKLKGRIDIFKRKLKYDYYAPYLTEIPKYIMVCYYEYFIYQIPIFDFNKIDLFSCKVSVNMMPIFMEYDLFSEVDIDWRINDWYSKNVTTCRQQLEFKFDESDCNEAVKAKGEEMLRAAKF